MENTTLISDPPDKAQGFSNQVNELKESNNGNYTPLNIHPNPYGISDKNPIMPNPEFQQKPNANNPHQDSTTNVGNLPHQPIPSRDIPTDTNVYIQDPSVKPNFIPTSNKSDFLEDFEQYENDLIEQENVEKNKDNFDFIMGRIQIPALLCVLFYFFNTFFVRNILVKPIPTDLIYSDGNLNKYGLMYISICFGLAYFIIDAAINYIGNI